jgi:hypothetical protein
MRFLERNSDTPTTGSYIQYVESLTFRAGLGRLMDPLYQFSGLGTGNEGGGSHSQIQPVP